MNAKKQKLAEQFKTDTPRNKEIAGVGSGIFAGVSIHVNGYTGKYSLNYEVRSSYNSPRTK